MDQNLFNDICLQQLTLSGVHEGETVVVLTRGAERTEYADAFLWAIQKLGATGYHMRLPSPASAGGAWAVGDSGLGNIPLAVDALKAADMVVDCTFLLFSKEQFAIQDAGTRILTAVEPPELLARLMPTTELRERVETGAELLAKASTMRITSPHGTDVTYRLGMYPTMSEYGYTDTPAAGTTGRPRSCSPAVPTTASTGRSSSPPATCCCRSTPTCRPRSRSPSRRASSATSAVARAPPGSTRTCCAPTSSFDDPRGYGMSHVGWGLDERAHWHGLTQFGGGMGMELRSFYGNVMFSIGPNNELGGPNDTACHFDIPMRGNSLFLDDELIVDAGELTVPEMRPVGKR